MPMCRARAARGATSCARAGGVRSNVPVSTACFTCRPALSSVCGGANGAAKELKNDESPRERRVSGAGQPKGILGWSEWVALPEFGVGASKAKVDTGARTAALQADQVDEFEERGVRMVRFALHPYQRRSDVEVACLAAVANGGW